ncbi:hypothetical protein [Pseudoalteromonas gelatinilytica]|uniref:hypothetical protein n=1 Tax=Pseudoalteromonas gelatinilytica TaxID=1703256 RepID=UPI0007C43475|nr:hypothetical protein [Pseudoalteromonas gelatinilytica]
MENDKKESDENVVNIGREDSESEEQSKTEDKTFLITRKKEIYRLAIFSYLLLGIGAALIYTARLNPEIFTLHDDTLLVITDAYNVIVLLLVPLLFGALGASSRVMLSGLKVGENLKLVFSSGLIAAFSWLGIKSKVFLALVTPYISNSQIQNPQETSTLISETGSEIYSMILVAVIVGMFSSNIYIFINQRVEQLTGKVQSSPNKKINKDT